MSYSHRDNRTNPDLALNEVLDESPSTPFQDYCYSKYASVPTSFRPSPKQFLAADPKVMRAIWVDSPPECLVPDISKDSAVDILRKMQTRNLGGARLVNAYSTPCTDRLTRGVTDELATPTDEESQCIKDYLTKLEQNPNVARCCNPCLPDGDKIFALPHGKLSVLRFLRERSARIYDPEASIPHLRTASGKMVESFSNLALRVHDPISVHGAVAKELIAVTSDGVAPPVTPEGVAPSH